MELPKAFCFLFMNQHKYHMIGLMSGTSCDGLDVAYCEFWRANGQWSYAIKAAETLPYQLDLRQKLKRASQLSAVEIAHLDAQLGRSFGEACKTFIDKHELCVDAIASHGHTVFHQPDKGFSLQIGSGQQLHAYSQTAVICDFRSLDIAYGGQGAPLVPIGDRALFSSYDVCINLGGIANLSYEANDERRAYDICPFNLVFNHLSQYHGQDYDKGGNLARRGKLHDAWYESLNSLPFYKASGPKSLGIEWLQKHIFPYIPKAGSEDLLHSFSKHTALQIAAKLKAIAEEKRKADLSILLSGGGAYNTFFVENLKASCQAGFSIKVAEPLIVEFKEALIFAFMGMLRLRGEINCLATVTGASKDVSGGIIVGK